jgi:3-phenylpropionate/trans-cinnamate dioxygenase ferredoxin subunit
MSEWIFVCHCRDFINDRFLFVHDGQRIALFQLDDAIYAIADQCSHAEASLAEGDLEADEGVIVCPRHGARFDVRSGRNLSFPAVTPVRPYRLKENDGQIFIAMP